MQYHFGVDRTLYLTCILDESVTRDEVEDIVKKCIECQSIDPAPVTHERGMLSVTHTWQRLAADITHYHGKLFLSIIDCGPSRFAIWKEIPNETGVAVTKKMEEIFRERSAPDELLLDNGGCFRSAEFRGLCERWGVRTLFRCAHRASGNGIVERHHRTIKRMAERSKQPPEKMVFWYNLSPKSGTDGISSPHKGVYSYEWRHPGRAVRHGNELNDEFSVGDYVWVKPGDARCTTRWNRGQVTDILGRNNVEVDGVPRHILDIREIFREDLDSTDERGETQN